jgi:uncharacterized protein
MTQPPYGGGPVGYASSDEKRWALIAHFGGVLGFIPALIAFLVKGKRSPTVRAHSAAALNFQIVVTVAAIVLHYVMLALPGEGLVNHLADVVWVFGVVFAIVAGLQANNGQLYRYPTPLQIIR